MACRRRRRTRSRCTSCAHCYSSGSCAICSCARSMSGTTTEAATKRPWRREGAPHEAATRGAVADRRDTPGLGCLQDPAECDEAVSVAGGGPPPARGARLYRHINRLLWRRRIRIQRLTEWGEPCTVALYSHIAPSVSWGGDDMNVSTTTRAGQ